LTAVAGGAALAVLGLLTAPQSASAEDPVELGGAYIVDTVGALDSDRAQVDDALGRLDDETGIQLFVVFVDSFDGVSADASWAGATAELNRLGTDDVLFAVATADRNYDFSYPDDFALDARTTTAIEDRVLDRLADEDWSGAVVTAADGYRSASDGASAGGASGGPLSAMVGVVVFIVLAGVVVIVVVVIVTLVRRRRRAASAVATARLDDEALEARVGKLLVQLDDDLASSEQELGFATAQFGDAASAPFAESLARARAQVAEAFTLKQQLDDASPETPAHRRELGQRIVHLCESADRELDSQADAFAELRDLEKTAPAELVTVRSGADAAAARISECETALTGLSSTYSPPAVGTVVDNPRKARELLGVVADAAKSAETALAAGETGDAAVAVRTARAGLGQVDHLLDAIDSLGAALGEAASSLDASLADTRADIAAARALPASPQSDELGQAILAAETAVSGAAVGDPLARLALISEANARLEAVFGGVRDAQNRLEHARLQLDGAIAAARSRITAANDFIATRRGAVGERPRTAVADAERRLDAAVALAVSDPVSALAEAQRSAEVADRAVTTAQSEVASVDTSPWAGERGGGSSGSGIGDALIGGILGSLLGGGGSRGGGYGGGFGGGSWGGGGGGSWGGGYGGSSRSSSSRSSSSRSSGSRRSSSGSSRSGGGRSRSSRGRF
jgi:hypothetical protein